MKARAYGEGRIYERPGSSNKWIEYWVNGEQYRESSGSPDEHVAAALLRRRIAEKRASEYGLAPFVPPQAQRGTVDELLNDLLEDYRINGRKSLPTTYYHCLPIRRWLGECTVGEVTASKLRWYVARRLDEGRSNATINRELSALRRGFNLAKGDDQLRQVPTFPKLPEHNIRRGFFEASQLDLVVRCLPDYLQDLTRFAYLTGWRRSEITGLQWDMVNLEERTITLPMSKNNKGRLLILVGDLWDIIQRREADRAIAPWVFHRYGTRIQAFRKAWASACQAAGIPRARFHDFRRSAVRNLTRAGVPEKIAMDMTGHKTRSIYDRYNITSEADLREAARKLQTYLAGQPAHFDDKTRTVRL